MPQCQRTSGTCGNSLLPPLAYGPHAVLWEADGSVHDLGNLGGAVTNMALAMNNKGQILAAALVVVLIIMIVVPLLIRYTQNEAAWTTKTTHSTRKSIQSPPSSPRCHRSASPRSRR